MNRFERSIEQLWGRSEPDGTLGPEPSFAAELDARCGEVLDLSSIRVSKWTLGKQLEHLYLSTHYVLDRVEDCLAGKDPNRHMGMYGVGLMVGGFIPRGVFPTIPPLEPKSGTLEHIEPLKQQLRGRLASLRWDLETIRDSIGKSKHPRMKYLTATQWLYFAEIHHRHHLSIIRDIRSAAN
jgi:hypothetical protein